MVLCMVCIWLYGECMMSGKFDYQGKTKQQVEFSTMMVGLSIVGVIVVVWFYATYYLLMRALDWLC